VDGVTIHCVTLEPVSPRFTGLPLTARRLRFARPCFAIASRCASSAASQPAPAANPHQRCPRLLEAPLKKDAGNQQKYLTGCAMQIAIQPVFDPRAPSKAIQAPQNASLHPQDHSRHLQPFAVLTLRPNDPRNDDVTNRT
jgi:hypothetical protein